MEEKNTNKIITAIIAFIVSMGVTLGPGVIDSGELKDYYICDLTQDIQKFEGGISGTAYSGYPFKDSRKGAMRCGSSDNKGQWLEILKYSEDNGIDPYDLILNEKIRMKNITNIFNSTNVICVVHGCIEK